MIKHAQTSCRVPILGVKTSLDTAPGSLLQLVELNHLQKAPSNLRFTNFVKTVFNSMPYFQQ